MTLTNFLALNIFARACARAHAHTLWKTLQIERSWILLLHQPVNICPEVCWPPYFQSTEQIWQLSTCRPCDIQKRRFAVSPHSTTWPPYYDRISAFFFTPPHALLPSWAAREMVLTGCSCQSPAVKLPSLPSCSPSLSPWATADNT